MDEIKQNQENTETSVEQKSKNGKNLIFGLAIIAIFIAAFIGAKNWLEKIANDNPNPAESAASAQQETGNSGALTQINGDPNSGIEVSANYEKEKSQNQAVFKLSFNTHVADYSGYDFKENILTRDSQNKEYKAMNFTPEGSGHHQSIVISFPAVSSPFKLVVKNLAGVPERIFNF